LHEKRIPIHFVRYEDLYDNPREELIKIFKFMLDLDDLEGTNCLKRIDEVVKEK
jgi:phenylpyruvate tautomerase PptA (4-oxalocrotonate tautomerase family)